MKIYRSNNIFVPIIEIKGEYYLVDFVPKWYEMFFGFWRVALFCHPARKIGKEELSKYTKDSTVKENKRLFLASGIGAAVFGSSLRRALKSIDLLVSFKNLLFIMTLVHIVCFSMYYFYLRNKRYNRIKEYEYKIKYRVFIKPLNRLIMYFLMTALVFWIQLGQFEILTLSKYISNYSFSKMFPLIISIVFWWFNVIHFIPAEYGEIVVLKIEE